MNKPLFRWTVGSCLQQGIDILAESIDRTTEVLGVQNWNWAICYNGLTKQDLDFLRKRIGDKPIRLYSQDWSHCPVPDNCQTPRRADGSFIFDGKICGGSLWKICPPRLAMDSHEIVMDNDCVILNKIPQIEQFLESNKVLILEEPHRFYGRYECLFSATSPNINSGLMGFPPGYDFGKAIYDVWVKHGSFMNLTQADEQGLLMHTLNQHPSLHITSEQVIEILHREFNKDITLKEGALHFVQSNRIPNHRSWLHYMKLKYGVEPPKVKPEAFFGVKSVFNEK